MASGLTIVEMHRGVRIGVQQVDANFIDGFLPEEIDYYINRSIREYIKVQQGFLKSEESPQFELALENLRTLVTHEQFSTFANSTRIPLAKKVTLPSDPAYDFFIHAHVDYNSETRNCLWITYIDLQHFLATQNNPVPWFERVPILLYEDSLHVMRERSEDTITQLDFVYVKEFTPVDINTPTNCDLPNHTHEEIVNRTVAMIVTDVRQSRGQQQAPQS